MIAITNNFTELKSVFKRYDSRNVYPLITSDIVERFYLLIDVALIMFSVFTSPQKRRMPLSDMVFWIVALLLLELITDWCKFLCISKFNHLPSSIYDDYHRLHQADVVSVRKHTTKCVSFTHCVSRRLHFQGLPLSALIIVHVFYPALAGTPVELIWEYRASVFACLVAMKIATGIGLLGNALQAEDGVKEKLVPLKAL